MENLKDISEIRYQSLKEIQVKQVKLKRELKNYKVIASKLHRQLNPID